MTDDGLVVLIPTYRRRKLLERAVDSVIEQTWPPAKIRIGLDGYDDPSLEYVRDLEAEFPHWIECWSLPHGGAYRTLNRLLFSTQATQVAILADDDFWAADFLERVGDFDPYSYAFAFSDWLRGEERVRNVDQCRFARNALRTACVVNLSTVVLSGKYLAQVSRDRTPFDATFHHSGDWDFLYRLSRLAPIYHVCEPLVHYGVHPGQISGGISPNVIFENARVRGTTGCPMSAGEIVEQFGWWARRVFERSVQDAKQALGSRRR